MLSRDPEVPHIQKLIEFEASVYKPCKLDLLKKLRYRTVREMRIMLNGEAPSLSWPFSEALRLKRCLPPCPRILKSLDPDPFDGDGFLEVRRSPMRNFKNYFDLGASRAGIPFKLVTLDRPKYRLDETIRDSQDVESRVNRSRLQIRRALGVPLFIVP
ncbi:uncharacterized protein LOC108153655 isoform X2 [Drosophila miranda]|uniref:uncharacterized protein LOC108153655 isoform X2 n=1 Tax=Drosophila miranda TaxID=7229 RepID=UPI0007E6A8AF|nr:uncharacterized protein LOC108153655 isoform X2 [Drosophila miranda]